MAQILPFTGDTILPLPPDTVLQGALGQLQSVVVIGSDADGKLYLSSSTSYLPDVLWLLEQARERTLQLENPTWKNP